MNSKCAFLEWGSVDINIIILMTQKIINEGLNKPCISGIRKKECCFFLMKENLKISTWVFSGNIEWGFKDKPKAPILCNRKKNSAHIANLENQKQG